MRDIRFNVQCHIDDMGGVRFHIPIVPYYFVADSNKILAVITSVCSFMYFKDLRFNYSPFINAVGACIFGVLLIHANSDTMRRWLWHDVLNNVGYYSSDWIVLHAIISVVAVFSICVFIDYLRIRIVEKWIFRYVDKVLLKHNIK